jgi:hypothetical protein
MGNQILGSDKVVRLNDAPLLGNVQSFDWSPAFNTEDIFELGRTDKIASAQELETQGSFEVLSVGGTAGVLARMIVKRNGATSAFEGYDYTSGNNNAYTYTQANLKECMFDVISHEKSDQLSFDRSLILPRCFLTSVSGRADANGSANETFNFGGDFVIGAPAPYHAVRAVPATRTTATTATLADATVTSAGYGLMYFYIDERRLRTTNTDAVYATLGAGGVVTITGMTIPVTSAMRAIVWDNTSPTTTFPALLDADRGTTARFVRGWQADVFIAPANVSSPTQNEKWLKVQSIDWNVDMRTEALRQIAYNPAGTAIYCRLPTYPFNISANVSVYEGDWADWKAVLDPTVKPMAGTGTNVYTETYDFAVPSLKDGFAVVIQYRQPKTGALLQTWKFTDMRVDGYGARVNVGGRSEIQWTLRGTAFELVGANA